MSRSLARLLWNGRAPGAKLYLPVSSGIGLYKDIVISSVARLLGYCLVLHHHTYAYIYDRDLRVATLDRLVGRGGAHIVHCALMRDDFLKSYNSQSAFFFVPPTIVAKKLDPLPQTPHQGFALGFLSNLSIAKGLDDAIAVFEQLAAENRQVRLVLAGPCYERESQQLIDAAVARWPGQVSHLGPVYDDAKARFFATIDAFVFPTRNESWGIVLSEALASGCPVIARSRGCIPWIVRNECGHVIDSATSFAPAAAQHLRDWIDSPEAFAKAQAAARMRSRELELDAERELPEFVRQVFALGSDSAERSDQKG
jgi:glycosyltransferase involved in cell wall biosynthesis